MIFKSFSRHQQCWVSMGKTTSIGFQRPMILPVIWGGPKTYSKRHWQSRHHSLRKRSQKRIKSERKEWLKLFQSKSNPGSVVQTVAATSFTSNLRIRIRVQIIANDEKWWEFASSRLRHSQATSPRNKYDLLFKCCLKILKSSVEVVVSNMFLHFLCLSRLGDYPIWLNVELGVNHCHAFGCLSVIPSRSNWCWYPLRNRLYLFQINGWSFSALWVIWWEAQAHIHRRMDKTPLTSLLQWHLWGPISYIRRVRVPVWFWTSMYCKFEFVG